MVQPLTMQIYIIGKYGATANNQLTTDPEDRKMPSLGSQLQFIVAFHFVRVATC